MPIRTFTKKLCMNQLTVRLSTIPQNSFFDMQKNAKLTAAFIYISKGDASLCTDMATLNIHSGTLLYIPENTVYTIKWLSDERIKYYTIFSTASDYNTSMMKDNFHLQIIDELSNKETGKIFSQLYDLMSSGERIKKIQAVSVYYSFYADALQYLRSAPERSYHPALLAAISHISENYNKNETLSDIAKACCISATRLHHLFSEQIGTTPIAFRNEKRIQKAAELLATDISLSDICEQTGFNSVPYFCETFKQYTKLTPGQYRRSLQ